MKRPVALPPTARRELVVLLPAAIVLAVVFAWAATGGGYEARPALGGSYEPNPWYLGALVLVGLLCAIALALGRVRLSRWTAVACAALAAYTAWSFLSILWAHDQGAAFLGSDRALVYTAAFVAFAILPWSAWSARVALALLVAGLGTIAIVTAIRLAVLADPSGLYLNARLNYPLGYYNADAALFTAVALTSVALCSRREGPPLARIAGLLVAAVCLQLAVLGQSRGWLFTAPVALVLALILVPGRLRLLAFALGPIAAAAAAAPALLGVYSHATVAGLPLPQPRLGEVLHQQGAHAARAMLIADAVLALLATAAVLADRRVRAGTRLTRVANRAAAVLAVLAVLGGVAAALAATHGHPVARVESAWHSFASSAENDSSSSRFATLGSQRVDFWRVALHEWSAHPLLGIGQDNFAASYLALRHTEQEPRWAHSLELRLLVHTGLVGALLFGLFVVALVMALLGTRGRPAERVAAGIALLPFVVWLVHGSLDWFWEIPALSVPALAFAAVAAVLGGHGTAGEAQQPARSRRWPAVARWIVIAVLGGGSLAALAIPFAAAHQVQRAISVWPARPALAYDRLRSASSLLPFDAQIYLVGGSIALNRDEPRVAREWFEKAMSHDKRDWLAPFALGLVAGEACVRAHARACPAAHARLRHALALNPREPVVRAALARASGPHPLEFAEAQAILNARRSVRFGG